MFETCMVESAGQLKSTNTKWTTASAFVIEGTLLALVVLATMVRPEMLPATANVIHLSPPYSPPRVTEVVPSTPRTAAAHPDVMTIPTTFPTHARTIVDTVELTGPPPIPGVFNGPRDAHPIIDIVGSSANPPVTHVDPPKRMIISTIDPARLTQRIDPSYPPLARQVGVQGTVMLHAIINRDGSIESLQVVSGHPMLVNAALEAVRRWRYKPTYLGGQPVEVETTITVNFKLAH